MCSCMLACMFSDRERQQVGQKESICCSPEGEKQFLALQTGSTLQFDERCNCMLELLWSESSHYV